MIFEIKSIDETTKIGFNLGKLLNPGDIVSIIEWANYIEEILPREYIHIHISKDLSKGDDFRNIKITPYGDRYDYVKEVKIW